MKADYNVEVHDCPIIYQQILKHISTKEVYYRVLSGSTPAFGKGRKPNWAEGEVGLWCGHSKQSSQLMAMAVPSCPARRKGIKQRKREAFKKPHSNKSL